MRNNRIIGREYEQRPFESICEEREAKINLHAATFSVFLYSKTVFWQNFTCKTIAMIQQALGEKIVEVTK